MESDNTKELAYFLGVICGDGYVGRNGIIEVKSDDFEFLNGTYAEVVNKIFDKRPTIRKELYKKFTYYRAFFYSKKAHDFLKENGIISPKTFIVRMPEIIRKSNILSKNHFVRGVFDTDGTVYTKINKDIINYPTVQLESRSENLIKDIEETLILSCLKAKRGTYIKRDKPAFVVRVYGFEQLRMFMAHIGFSKPKKLKKAERILNEGIKRTGR
jgi:intein/homing endonuclease